MARETVNTGNIRFTNSSAAPVDTLPFTIAGWYKATISHATPYGVISVHNSGGTNYASLSINNNYMAGLWRDTGLDVITINTYPLSQNVWYHGVFVVVSLSERHLYVDGGNKKTDTTTRTAITVDQTSIGYLGGGNEFTGLIAEAGYWDVALSDGEAKALGMGYSPLLIRPESLQSYYQLLEQSASDDAIDIVSGIDLTPNGSPAIQTHPPHIIYPTRAIYGAPAAAAADEKVMQALFRGRQVLAPRSRL